MTLFFDVFVAAALVALLMLIRHIAGHAAAKRRSACEQKGCNLGCGSLTDSEHP